MFFFFCIFQVKTCWKLSFKFHNLYLNILAIRNRQKSTNRWFIACPSRQRDVCCIVVKIANWLLKSYDFTNQHAYNVSNRVKTRNRSNLVKIGKIGSILRVWVISSFNPQKLKNVLSSYLSPLILHYIVPTPQSPFSLLSKSQIFNLSRLTLALENLEYGEALYCILGREGMIGGSKLWEDKDRWWWLKGVK